MRWGYFSSRSVYRHRLLLLRRCLPHRHRRKKRRSVCRRFFLLLPSSLLQRRRRDDDGDKGHGITFTNLVGVLVLCFSRSEIFVVYCFQMYLALVVIGLLHGLVFLSVALSLFGPPSKYTITKEQLEDIPSAASEPSPSG